MVNSGWCRGPRSRLRNTWAKVNRRGLAGGQQLLAGELGRGVQVEPAMRACRRWPWASVAKACRWVSLPGETCRMQGSTSTKPRASNQRAQRAPGCGRGRAGTAAGRRGRRGCHQGERRQSQGVTLAGPRAAIRGKGTATLASAHRRRRFRSRKEHHGEGHCQLAAQGQRRRSRRQALRRADGAEHPSRQGHAGDPARPAPDQRRGEDLRALPHHRAGRARLRRIAASTASSTGTTRGSTS